MSAGSNDISLRAAERMRAFRKARRITGETFASQLTRAGYPISRTVLTNFETGRFKHVPVDLVVAAMKVLGVGFHQFMVGPLCGTCNDKPPTGFICQTCLRTEDKPEGVAA